MTVVAWSRGIRITFDKEIVTSPDITVQLNVSNYGRNMGSAISSGDYSVAESKDKPFDGNTSTRWTPNTYGVGKYIGRDFGTPVSLTKIRLRQENGTGTVNIQGSNDGTNWTNVVTGWSIGNSTSYQENTFTGEAYRYWRIYYTAMSWYVYIYEMEFTGTYMGYDVSAWTVTAQEYDKQPAGTLTTKTYTVERIIKSVDNLSVVIWLANANRMLDPDGLVTVSYAKSLGNLAGAYSSQVEDFTVTFIPTGITPIFNPNDQEYISITPTGSASIADINFIDGQSKEYINLSPSAEAVLCDINGIPV